MFAPYPNSYRRYVPDSFAPTTITWGRDNRTCAFRLIGEGNVVPCREPGARRGRNPYLAFSGHHRRRPSGHRREARPWPRSTSATPTTPTGLACRNHGGVSGRLRGECGREELLRRGGLRPPAPGGAPRAAGVRSVPVRERASTLTRGSPTGSFAGTSNGAEVSRSPVEHHGLLGRATRTGPLAAQAVSTHRLIEAAVADGRDSDAAELARYTLVEMAEPSSHCSLRSSSRRGASSTARRRSRGRPRGSREPARPSLPGDRPGSPRSRRVLAMPTRQRSRPSLAACCGAPTLALTPTPALPLARSRLTRPPSLDGVSPTTAPVTVCTATSTCARERLGEDRVEAFWDESDGRFLPDAGPLRHRPLALGASRSRSSRSTPRRLSVAISRDPAASATSRSARSPTALVFSFSPCGTGGRSLHREPERGRAAPGVPMDDPDRFGVTTRAS